MDPAVGCSDIMTSLDAVSKRLVIEGFLEGSSDEKNTMLVSDLIAILISLSKLSLIWWTTILYMSRC